MSLAIDNPTLSSNDNTTPELVTTKSSNGHSPSVHATWSLVAFLIIIITWAVSV